MKRIALVFAALLLVGAFAASADIVGSKHDLTTATGTAGSTTGNTAEVCVFCHTPHAASSAEPLWNRTTSAGPYTMYDSTASATIDMTVASAPQAGSTSCLSCHDGTIGFDVLINAPGSGNYNAAGADAGWVFTSGDNFVGIGGVAYLGTDLSNDHPISVTYDPAQDPDFKALATVQGSSLRLYGSGTDQVECGSCHDPHLTTNGTFLRISNAASAICTTCHSK